jgi:WD40 repeat protein/HEAT repeat protein
MMPTKQHWLSRVFGTRPAEDQAAPPAAATRPTAANDAAGPTFAATVPATPPADQPRPIPAAPGPEDDVPAVWQVGDLVLGLYEVKQVFQGGGMGLVYRVRHRTWNMDLAVKSPRPEYFRTEVDKENFEREAETWVNLGLHPHVASCHYVRRLGGIPRVFAEFLAGGSLQDWIRDGRLYAGGPDQGLERILDVAIQFAWGLDHAHGQGLVHQDVKPANVLMTPEGQAHVTDFGLARARAASGAREATPAGQSLLVSAGGMTPAYCSPEQAAGRSLSRRTDIWSWAASVLEMFTGDVTWPSGTVAGAALEGYLEMGTGDDRLPRMPAPLVQLLRSCFSQEPEGRPADMKELAGTLQGIYRQVTGRAHGRELPRVVELRATSLNNRAVSLVDLGKEQEADRQWAAALAQDPQYVEAIFNRGLLAWRRGALTDGELIQQLTGVCQTQQGRWLPRYLLAQVHLERGDCQGALDAVGALLGADSERAEVQQVRRLAADLGPLSRRQLIGQAFHKDSVRTMAFSPDGSRLVSGGADKVVRLWDVATGHWLHNLGEHGAQVKAVAFSADGRDVLSASDDRFDRTVKLRDAATNQGARELAKQPLTSWTALAFSPNRRWAAAAGEDRAVKVWDVVTGQVLRTLTGHQEAVEALAFRPDGRLIASAGKDRTIRLWEAATGRCLRILEGHTDRLLALAFRADGCLIASAGKDRTIRLWDVTTGETVRTLSAHTHTVTSLSFGPDGRWLVSGNWDSIRLWDLTNGRCARTLTGSTGVVEHVAFSPDGRRLASADDKTVRFWDPATAWEYRAPLTLGQLETTGAVTATARSFEEALTGGQRCLAQGDFQAAVVAASRARSLSGYERHPEALALWGQLYCRASRGALQACWESQVFRRGPSSRGGMKQPGMLAFSPDGRHLATIGQNGVVSLWATETGQSVRTLACKDEVGPVAFHPDGQWLAVSGASGIQLWEVTTGRYLRTLNGNGTLDDQHAKALVFSPDGRCLARQSESTIDVLDVATGHQLTSLEGEALAFSPDGRWVAVADMDGAALWHVATGQKLRPLGIPETHDPTIACRPDGSLIAIGSGDKICLFETGTGLHSRTLEGHVAVKAIAFSPDGRWLASAGLGRKVCLCEAADGAFRLILEGHSRPVDAMAFSPDGRWLASGDDESVRLWFLDWELEDRAPADWDDAAAPYLDHFLANHRPFGGTLPDQRAPTRAEVAQALRRQGQPQWSEEDFRQLLSTLGSAGYGWLRPEGVRRELQARQASFAAPAWEGRLIPAPEEEDEENAVPAAGPEFVLLPHHPTAFVYEGVEVTFRREATLSWSDDRLVLWTYGSDSEFHPAPEDWEWFWAAMNLLGVWGWQSYYHQPAHGGGFWKLELAHAGRRVASAGANDYPPDFSLFRAALDLLIGKPVFCHDSRQGLLALFDRFPRVVSASGQLAVPAWIRRLRGQEAARQAGEARMSHVAADEAQVAALLARALTAAKDSQESVREARQTLEQLPLSPETALAVLFRTAANADAVAVDTHERKGGDRPAGSLPDRAHTWMDGFLSRTAGKLRTPPAFLKSALRDPQGPVRYWAARVVGYLAEPETYLPDLLYLRADPEESVRHLVVYLLADVLFEGAVKALLPLLADPSAEVCGAAVMCCGDSWAEGGAAVPALVARLGDPAVRPVIEDALIRLAETVPEAAAALLPRLAAEALGKSSASSEVLERMREIGGRHASLLFTAVTDAVRTQFTSRKLLDRLIAEVVGPKQKEGVPVLIAALREEAWQVRYWAGAALARIGPAAAPAVAALKAIVQQTAALEDLAPPILHHPLAVQQAYHVRQAVKEAWARIEGVGLPR